MDLLTLVNTVKVASQATGIKITGGDKINAIKDTGKTLITAKNINKINSIKGKARESIAQYPVLVSENLNPKLVPILTNALEVEYSSLVWLVISNASSFDSGNAGSVINQFHNASGTLTERTFLAGVDSTHALYEANKKLLQPYEESFNMNTLNESYYTKSLHEYLTEKNDNIEGIRKRMKQLDRKSFKTDKDYDNALNSLKSDLDRELKVADNKRKDAQYAHMIGNDKKADERYAADMKMKQTNQVFSNTKTAIDTVGSAVNIATNISREIDRKKDRQMDKKKFDDDQAQRNYSAGKGTVQSTMRDLAKVNDLHPTILNIEVNFREPGTNSVVTKQLSIGVKCVSHLLKSEDIQYYLSKAAYKNSGLLRLIKWTTGEIKFWKDLIFTMDDIKLSAIQNSKTVKNKNYLSKLEYIAKTSKQAILTGAKKDAVPKAVTTLIITKTDVDNIKYKDGVNILANPDYLKKIYESYYLLNLLIVDESLDVVYNYDAFTNTINRQPFSSYEKNSKERVINANDLFKLAR